MQGCLENWFATQILIVDASPVIDSVKQIFAATDFLQFKDDSYVGGSTSYHCGSSDPFLKHPRSNELIAVICQAASHIAVAQGVDMSHFKPVVTEIWITQMGFGASHAKHVHAGSHFSGTFYLNAPDGCAPIRFYSPLEMLWSFCPLPQTNNGNEITSSYVDHHPSPGKLAIWNSWLSHEVLLNATHELRESVSFNIRLERVV